MLYIFFAWIASVSYAVEVIISKLGAKYSIKNPWEFNFFLSLFILMFVTPIAIYNHAGFPKEWGSIFSVAIFLTLTTIFYTLALYKLDISILSPLFTVRAGFVAILSVPILGELLTPFQYILIAILTIAGLCLIIDDKFSLKTLKSPGVVYILTSAFFLALWNISTKQAILQNGYWETSLWTTLISQIFLLPTIMLFRKTLFLVKKRQMGLLLTCAAISTTAFLTSNKAFETNATITSAILSLPVSLVFAAILSFIFPKLLEKHKPLIWIIRFSSAGIMILAAFFLSKP